MGNFPWQFLFVICPTATAPGGCMSTLEGRLAALKADRCSKTLENVTREKKNGPKRNNLSEIGCFDLLIYCVLLVLWIMSFITTARSSSLVSKHQWVIQGEEGTVPMSRQWCSRPYPMNWRVPLSCWGPLRSWLHHLFGEWKTGFCYAQLSVGGLASAGWCSPHRQSWKGTQQSF